VNLSEALVALRDHLDASGVPWAVIGGLGVSARAAPRFTLDADIAIAVADDVEAERVVAELRSMELVPVAMMEQDYVERLAGVRLAVDANGPLEVDILFASSGIESEIARDASRIDLVPGIVAPVAQIPHLIALEVLSRDSRRPQDDVDLQSLLVAATSADIVAARKLLDLITSRGYARNKNLSAELDAVIERFGPAPD
jgi:hypothetical protein